MITEYDKINKYMCTKYVKLIKQPNLLWPEDNDILIHNPQDDSVNVINLMDKYKSINVFLQAHTYSSISYLLESFIRDTNISFIADGNREAYYNICIAPKLKNIYDNRAIDQNPSTYNNPDMVNNKNFIEELLIAIQQEEEKTNVTVPNIETTNDVKKKKKKPITATIRRLVWNTHIGEEIGKSKCLCCKVTDITQMSFNCGHIIAEANGGKTIVSNLKPICQNCNSSMGTKNMEEFMSTLN